MRRPAMKPETKRLRGNARTPQDFALMQENAHRLLNREIQSGRMERGTHCEQCGRENDRLHGHHDSYVRPLAVRWLCSPCHRKWHSIYGHSGDLFPSPNSAKYQTDATGDDDYYTEAQIRATFNQRIAALKQVGVARASGAKTQHVSQMAHGAPIGGKVLAWLGYRPVKGMYEKAGN